MYYKLLNLRKEFKKIQNQEFHKSVVKGYAGVGQTFERLLGKKSDASSAPDYNGIEIKTKLGYTKTAITLFSLTPKSNYNYSIKYLTVNYGYPESSFSPFNVLRAEANSIHPKLVSKRYYFELMVDRLNLKVRLIIKDKSGKLLDNHVYWDFEELEKRLVEKLSYMALVITYPYNKPDGIYYKYFKMSLYKLRSFENFLQLIEEGHISVLFNIGIHKSEDDYGRIFDHGTAFKLDNRYIYKLFEILNI